jgi:NitT/TauT family transport system substrate-binding protein
MQDRRHFLTGGFSIAAAGLAGGTALVGARRSLATEALPETTTIRLAKVPIICVAPQYVTDDLLREEGFTDVQYVPLSAALQHKAIARGQIDCSLHFSGPTIIPIDAGDPIVILAGVHPGCFELFARNGIRSVLDLKGKNVGVEAIGASDHVFLSVIAAYVGLDPTKDINWITGGEGPSLFADGKLDAILAIPPEAQELRARGVGHVILNSTVDRPWSQYFCCMLIGNADFVWRNPIATKRVVRAMVRATDICASKPDWVAHRLVDRDFTQNYDYARQGLEEIPYRKWRDYDPEDTIRFYALRLHELGMIKSTPDKIIANGTDWRFLNAVKQELGI